MGIVIYILDEQDDFIKMTTVSGNPHNGLNWIARVYKKDKSGKWVFKQKVVFNTHLRNGITFVLRDSSHTIARYYVAPLI